jgi:CHAD domain-containing protein
VTSHDELLEVERTVAVEPGWTPPALGAVDGVARVVDRGVTELDAVYLDTPSLALLRRGVTLRRRSGGDDEGWHLKLPADGARTEIHAPLDGTEVPGELATLVDGLRLGGTLGAVARIRTSRSTLELQGGDGRVLAEVTVDDVRAESSGGRDEVWREVEVELVEGDRALLAAVVDALEASGARPSEAPVKLERALGVTGGWYRRQAPPAPETGGELATRYLREQVDELLGQDPRVRRDEPDAVHKARVATRRLRSALRTFRPVLDRDRTDPLRDELRWWGGVLGEARDREVQRDRVGAVLDGLPDTLVVGPVRARVARELDAGYLTAHAAAVGLMASERYLDLLVALDTLADDPPLVGRADEPADDVAARFGRHAARRVRRRARAVHDVLGRLIGEGAPQLGGRVLADPAEPGTTSPDASDPALASALHELRKAAKAARYAGEAVAPVVGKPAEASAAAYEDLQDVLGAHHDAVVLGALFRDMGMRAHLSGENGFTYGLLVGLERARAQVALAAFGDAWGVARRKRLRRWTRA